MDIFQGVYDWLCEESHGRWVIILDSADDMDSLTAVPPHHTLSAGQTATANFTAPQIRDFLSKSSIGTVLITSRNRNVAFELTGNANHYIQVEEMKELEAMALLKNKL
jgi:hypothetical protein